MSPQFSQTEPSKSFTKLLNWALPKELKEPLIGDLWEEYAKHIAIDGEFSAGIRYRIQALKACMHYMVKTKRGFIMLIVSLIAFLGLVIMAMLFGGNVSIFSDLPSIILVYPPAILFAIAMTSGKHAKLSVPYFLDLPDDADNKDIDIVVQFFKVLGNIGLWLGCLATVIGWVAIATNMDDFSALGPAFSLSILTIFYALLMKVVCYVAEQRIKTQQLIRAA